LEPDVEDWVEQGQTIGHSVQSASAAPLSDNDSTELWQWAPRAANQEVRKEKWGADYTLAEKKAGIQKVETGLHRDLVEPPDDYNDGEDDHKDGEQDSGDEDEAEGEEMEDIIQPQAKHGGTGAGQGVASKPAIPSMPLDSIFRFITTGNIDQ